MTWNSHAKVPWTEYPEIQFIVFLSFSIYGISFPHISMKRTQYRFSLFQMRKTAKRKYKFLSELLHQKHAIMHLQQLFATGVATG